MLHQIRKMIGLTIAIMRGHATEETIAKAFTQEKVNIPRAPGLGLVLDFVHYDRYNTRYGTDGMHETLEWNELEETVLAFKEKYIYPTIIDTEIRENSMLAWLDKLTLHSFEFTDEDDKSGDENGKECDDDDNGSDDKDEDDGNAKRVKTESVQAENKEENTDVEKHGTNQEADKSVPVNV